MILVPKKLPLIIAVVMVVFAGSLFVFNKINDQQVNSNTQTVNASAQTVTANNTQLSELPEGWRTYTSPEWGFSINHPSDVKIDLTQNGVHFLKLGETQAIGTELFDGLSLLVFSAQLHNKTFEDFVQQEYNKVKSEPVYESVTQLQDTQVANYSGFKYTATGIGTSTTYLLKNGNDGYIKIIDMTVEPSNANRDFHKTVNLMLNSFQVNPASPTDTGSQDKAVAAVKEFAAQDLNAPLKDVSIVSVAKREWSNSCMGLEQEGEACAEVITPGYEITVQTKVKYRIYRTNTDGSIIKIRQ